MKSILVLGILPFLFFAARSQSPVVIQNVTLIDMTSPNPKPRMTVVVEGGRISEIGRGLRVPKNATVVDGRGKFLIPGFWLELLVQNGFTPLEALRAATLNPARFLGLEKSLGTIEKGKLADLVLLDANPIDDIRNTREIFAVIINGKLYDRTSLDRMLTDVEISAR